MVRLFCTDGKGVFPVDIDEKKEVGDLKIAMAGALGYGERVAGLQLFVARKDKGRGAWLTQRDALQGLSDTRDFKPLQFPRVESRYIGLASEDLETVSIADKLKGKGHVHVVVVLPQRQIRIAVNHRYAETISSYMEIADRLKDSEEVRSLSERLMNLKMQGPPTPFVVLENSSGMGKTQMAFNLEARGECEVFYIVCGMLGDREQIVYKAFAERTVTFQTCVERDLKVMKEAQGKQGSIDAISAICGNTTLALYGFILAALHGSDQCLGNVHRSHIEDELDRRAEIGAKPFVFFLDEFPRVRRTNAHFDEEEQRERENELRTMINVFRSFDLAVVVSSTNVTARNLLTTSDRSRETGREIALKYVAENPYDGSRDLNDYLSAMAYTLARQFSELKRKTDEFKVGQLCLLLGTSYRVQDVKVNIIDHHFARLFERSTFELQLDAEGGLQKDNEDWKCRSVLPTPMEDMLLHLSMTGGRFFSPFGDKPLCAVMSEFQPLFHYGNTQQRSNDGMRLEALTTAAIVLASHAGGFGGVAFTTFLGKLLFELGVSEQFQNVDIGGWGKLMVPFLSPPNEKWPEWLNDSSMRFDNLIRTRNSDRIDFRTSSSQISAECSSPGNFNVVKNILNRVPAESMIHLVGTNTLQERSFTAEPWETFVHERLQNVSCYHISKGSTLQEIKGVTNQSSSTATVADKKLVLFIELGKN